MTRTDRIGNVRQACCAVGTALALFTLVDASRAQVQWASPSPTTIPDTRMRHGMAYDARRQETVVFGGDWSTTITNDTWLWNGQSWRLATPETRPPWRRELAMAYDSAREVVVMFGGSDFAGTIGRDTWEWNGTTWTERFPVNRPAVPGPVMAYDSARARMVLFGGLTQAETWEWDGTDWTQRTPTIQPAPRSGHTMAYDAARGVVVLHGGTGTNQTVRGDTWEWNGTSWSQRTLNNAEPMLTRHAMVYDTARQRSVVYGGDTVVVSATATGNSDEVWEWDGQAWRMREPLNPKPTASTDPGLAYDEARREIVLFGGAELQFWSWRSGPIYLASQETWLYAPTDPATHTPFGSSCVGSAGMPGLAAASGQLPWIGETFTVELTQLPANGNPAFLLLGVSNTVWSGLQLPLGFNGMPGCNLYVSADAIVPLANVGGTATWSVALCDCPGWLGLSLYGQGGAVDPPANSTGVTLSNAECWTFGAK